MEDLPPDDGAKQALHRSMAADRKRHRNTRSDATRRWAKRKLDAIGVKHECIYNGNMPTFAAIALRAVAFDFIFVLVNGDGVE